MWVVYSLLAVLGLILLVLLVPVYVRVTYDGTLRVKMRMLGVSVTLFPQKEKPQETPKPKKAKKQPKKAQKPSQKEELLSLLKQDSLAGTLGFLREVAGLVTRTAGKVLRAVTVDRLKLQVLIATGDPTSTATLYGKVCSVLYPTLTVIGNNVHIRRRELRVEPNFLLEKSDAHFDVKLRLSLMRLLGAGVYLLVKFVLLKEIHSSITVKEE